MRVMETRHHIMKKVFMVLPFCLFTLLPSSLLAQTFTQRVQQTQQGEGTLRIHQDATLDDLVNGPKQAEKPKPVDKQTKDKKEEKKQQEQQKPTPTEREKTQQEEQPVDTLDQKSKRTRKAMGFRIQVFAGQSSRQDRLKAEQTGNMLRQLFLTESVYVHYNKPRWLCRIGDFTNREDAEQMLADIRKAGYPAATIVRDKVNVPY